MAFFFFAPFLAALWVRGMKKGAKKEEGTHNRARVHPIS